MDPSKLSPENVIATVVAGIGLGFVALWKYLQERKAPTTQTGDRMIPGITIADMTPIRELAGETARNAAAMERIADSADGLLKLLTEQAKDDAIEQEVNRRVDERIRDRTRRTAR